MKYKLLIVVACILLMLLFCMRLYYEFVPRGASLEPFVGYSRELSTINSPAGKTYRVFVNDAGAMHSGNHWVWVVGQTWGVSVFVLGGGGGGSWGGDLGSKTSPPPLPPPPPPPPPPAPPPPHTKWSESTTSFWAQLRPPN